MRTFCARWRVPISGNFEIIPAIDLRNGKCVRLYQGDYDRETIYSDNPVEVARRWVELGATRLHIVDLDGARSGRPDNLNIIEEIVSESNVPVQVGGGVRSVETAASLLQKGVDRVIVGTIAIEEPDVFQAILTEVGPESVIGGIDAKDGLIATRGWTEKTDITAVELTQRLALIGLKRVLYTDISRDGTLTSPNFDAVSSLRETTGLAVIAAGGISSVAHLAELAGLGVESAVVGKALYTGDIDLETALASIQATQSL